LAKETIALKVNVEKERYLLGGSADAGGLAANKDRVTMRTHSSRGTAVMCLTRKTFRKLLKDFVNEHAAIK